MLSRHFFTVFKNIIFTFKQLLYCRYKYSNKVGLSRKWGFCYVLVLTIDQLLTLTEDDIVHIKKQSNLFLFRFIYINCDGHESYHELDYKAWLSNSDFIDRYLQTYVVKTKLNLINDSGLKIKKSNDAGFLHTSITYAYALPVLLFIVGFFVFLSFHQVNRISSRFSSISKSAESLYQLVLEQETNLYQVEYYYNDSLSSLRNKKFLNRAMMNKVINAIIDFVFYYFNQNYNFFLNKNARLWAQSLLKDKSHLTVMQRFARINFSLQYLNKRLLVTKSQVNLFAEFFKQYFDFDLNHDFIRGYFRYLNQQRTDYVFVPNSIENYLSHTMHTPQQLFQWFAYQERLKYGELRLSDLISANDSLRAKKTLPAYLFFDKESKVKRDLGVFMVQLQQLPWLRRKFSMRMSSLSALLWLSYQEERRQAWLQLMHSLSVTSLTASSSLFSSIKQFLLLTNKNLKVNFSYPWQLYQNQLQQLTAQWHDFSLQDQPMQAKLGLAEQVYGHRANFLDQQIKQLSQPLLNLDDVALAQDYQFVLQLPFTAFFQRLLSRIVIADNKQFRRRVYPFYARNIKDYFPFKQSVTDAQVSAVKQFLQNNRGIFWHYINRNLKHFLFYQQGWHLRSWHGITLPLAKQFISQLNAYTALSHVLFKKNCLLQFSVYPVAIPILVEQTVQYPGWQFHYSNGPQAWHEWCWPYHQQVLQYSVRFSHHPQAKIMHFYGHWAPLRLLLSGQSAQHPFSVLIKPGNLVSIINLLKHNKDLELVNDEKLIPQM